MALHAAEGRGGPAGGHSSGRLAAAQSTEPSRQPQRESVRFRCPHCNTSLMTRRPGARLSIRCPTCEGGLFLHPDTRVETGKAPPPPPGAG